MKLGSITVGAVAALIVATGVAFAGEDTGTISKIEWSLGTITLDNGHTYIVPPALQAQVLVNKGDKVKVVFSNRIAETITKLTS
jgi:hypothetical protein